MSTKSVQIEIDRADLEILKINGYKLCFAKMVGNTFDVVWQAYSNYLYLNIFQWASVYQLFGTNTFQEGEPVIMNTNTVNIDLGEQSTLDAAGVLENPVMGNSPTAITMLNDYGLIHPGLNQPSIGIDGNEVLTPIYVFPEPMFRGTCQLVPTDLVMVWFEQDIGTSTMFNSPRLNSVTIDLTGRNSATLLYSDHKWSTPPSVSGV